MKYIRAKNTDFNICRQYLQQILEATKNLKNLRKGQGLIEKKYDLHFQLYKFHDISDTFKI